MRGCNGHELKQFLSAFHTSLLPGLRSSDSIFWVGLSLQNPEKTVDKFAGSLLFLVGPSLQNPKKTAEKSKFRNFLDEPILQNPKKLRKNPHFKNFWGSPKICGKPQKIQILKPVHRGKTAKNFWMSPSFKIPRHCGKIRVSRIFGSPKNCRKLQKNSKFQNLYIAGKPQKIQIFNLFLVPCQKFPSCW
jgi:hypothetical protein